MEIFCKYLEAWKHQGDAHRTGPWSYDQHIMVNCSIQDRGSQKYPLNYICQTLVGTSLLGTFKPALDKVSASTLWGTIL